MDFWVILRTVDEGESCGIGFIAMREEKKGAVSTIQQVICLISFGLEKYSQSFARHF